MLTRRAFFAPLAGLAEPWGSEGIIVGSGRTNIAFAVGALTSLGKRVPQASSVSLLALTVIDDLGRAVGSMHVGAERLWPLRSRNEKATVGHGFVEARLPT